MKELIVQNYPKSSVAEAIKTVRTNLRFSSVNHKVKIILITSSISGEGKSFISSNLAATYADANEKVLLIDCDLRRGRQHTIFGVSNYNDGLSDLLIDNDYKKNKSKYLKKTEVKNLTILTSGSTPPNPSVLLESSKMENLIEELKEEYDTIIIDAPPVNGLNDALLLTKLSDTTLIVAKAKKTTPEMLESTKKSLEAVNANIAGVILNSIDIKDQKYYHNYYTDI